MPKEQTIEVPAKNNGNVADSINPLTYDESAWIESDIAESSMYAMLRLEIKHNTVTWQSGKNGRVQITRMNHASDTLAAINRQHAHTLVLGKPVTLVSAYVAKYRTVFNGEVLHKVLGVIAKDSNGLTHLLTSSYNFATQSTGKADFTKLTNMIATVEKAIALATKYGQYDAFNMVYDNTDTTTRSARPTVNTSESNKL